MRVKFEYTWFAPSDVVVKDRIQHVSGRRFKKGVQEVPDELQDYLPTSATVLEGPPKLEPQEEVVKTLREVDDVRKAADEFQEKVENAEEAAKQKKRENMAKARAARKAKQEAAAK